MTHEPGPPSGSTPIPVVTQDSPIADLTYRPYDGPLKTHTFRWWIVAVNNLRMMRKKPGFWVLAGLGALPYLFGAIMLYVQSRLLANAGVTGVGAGPNPMNGIFFDNTPGQKYSFQLFRALDMQLLFLLLISLMSGAGSIAADNLSNALLIYLSKPITKGDYLLGKWMGLFLTLYSVSCIPALMLYLYCLLSYGFTELLKETPWLFFQVLLATAVAPFLLTSVLVGISAWSKTPRMAGAILAGVYFVSNFIALIVWGVQSHGNPEKGILIQHLSFSGMMKGLAQNIYHLTHHLWVGGKRRGLHEVTLEPPTWWILASVVLGLALIGVVAARVKIRAVEVVRG